MIDYFANISPFILAVLSGLFTFSLTTLGSALVFFFRSLNEKVLTMMLGISSGVMIAASFWSLLNPAIELNLSTSNIPWLIPTLGFILGGALILFGDSIFSFFSKTNKSKRNMLLTSAVSLHNLPEGMAIGVTFGMLCLNSNYIYNLYNAIFLSIGIGIQNFPEGACVSLPLREAGSSRLKSFLIGSLSGAIEILGVIWGYLFSSITSSLLPFILSFAAGCMIAVTCSELIPDAFKKYKTIACIGLIIGFAIMMSLDVGLTKTG